MRARAPLVPADPTPAAAERLRAGLGLPSAVELDVACGDLVLVVPAELAGAIRLDGRGLPAGRRVLLGGERLRFGRRSLRMGRAASSAPPAGGTRTLARRAFGADFLGQLLPGPSLVVLEGPAAGRRWPLAPGRHVLGRGVEAEVVLAEPTVSRRHAELTVTEAGVMVRDLGSRHGTRVGRRRVRRARLRTGAQLVLGSARLRYDAGAAPAATARPLPVPRASGSVQTRRVAPGRRLLLVAAALLLCGGAATAAAALAGV